jgi:CspA family cold shock protein
VFWTEIPLSGRVVGMTVGTVKWFDESKGIGFIRSKGGTEVAVHYSAIQGDGFRTLSQGDEVEFEIRVTEGGLQAANVNRH